MDSNSEAVKEIYAAINRNDILAVLEFFDPQIVRVEFEGLPMAGEYHGLNEVSIHFSSARSTWAEGNCEPEQLIVEGTMVVALVHVHVRLKDKSEWIDDRIADVWNFRHGKVIEARSFLEAKEALEWARASMLKSRE